MILSFENKDEAAIALKLCGSSQIFRKAISCRVKDIYDGNIVQVKHYDAILKGLNFVYNDKSVNKEDLIFEEDVVNYVHSFLLAYIEERFFGIDVDNMKSVVRIAGALGSPLCHHGRSLLYNRVFIEKILCKLEFCTTPKVIESVGAVKNIIDIALKTQTMGEMKVEIIGFLSILSDGFCEDSICSFITECVLRVNDWSTIIRQGRENIDALLKEKSFYLQRDEVSALSKMISELIDRSLAHDDFELYCHVVKLFVLLGENAKLLDKLLRGPFAKFTQLFRNTLQFGGRSIEEDLFKFWLLKRTCDNIWLRNFLFQREGIILEILAIMRTTNLHAGDSLEVLNSFCDDSFFLDMSVTTAQMIQHFGEIFQFGDNNSNMRHDAEEILLIFAGGLEKNGLPMASSRKSDMSRNIATSFIDSGILYMLLSTISVNDSTSEWRAKGVNLLIILIQNESIQNAFLGEPLSVLRCLVTSFDSFVDKSSMFMELIGIIEVFASQAHTHERLFESDVVGEIINFIKDVQVAAYEINLVDAIKYINRCLNIIDVIATSSEQSTITLRDMKLEATLTSLLTRYDNQLVSDMVHEVLSTIYCPI